MYCYFDRLCEIRRQTKNKNETASAGVTTEDFIYRTHGLGVKDALAEQPDRKVKFIWRNHSTKVEDVKSAFTDRYDPGNSGLVAASVKYTVGHMYSSRRPQEWENRAADWLNPKHTGGYNYDVWMNLRIDDTFIHRWGSPDYVREFIRRMPLEHSPGFMMGADGYVWGKVFYSKLPEMQGQLAIDKHWYNYRLWGELAYNNDLDDGYWIKVLKNEFKLTAKDAEVLFDVWEKVSEVVPQLNRAVWAGTDAAFAAEWCIFRFNNATGFLNIPYYYYGESPGSYSRTPMDLGAAPVEGEEQCISIKEWQDSNRANPASKLTPLEVAEKLDDYADAVSKNLLTLQSASEAVDYQDLVSDLRSMAELGRYYADKQRSAAWYYAFRETGKNNDVWHNNAIVHIKDAQAHWMKYAEILQSHYKTQILARTHNLDWDYLYDGETLGEQIQTVVQETQAVIDSVY